MFRDDYASYPLDLATQQTPTVDQAGQQAVYSDEARVDDSLWAGDWVRDGSIWLNRGSGGIMPASPTGGVTALGDLPGWKYNGTTGLHSIAADSRLRPTEAVTVEVWASATALSSIKFLVNGCGNSAAAADAYMLFWYSNQLRFAINAWNVSFASVAFADTTDKMHHIVGTYDRAYTRVHLDGVAGTPAALVAAINYIAIKPLQFGTLQSAYYWTGRICAPRIYPGVAMPSWWPMARFQQYRHLYGV